MNNLIDTRKPFRTANEIIERIKFLEEEIERIKFDDIFYQDRLSSMIEKYEKELRELE